MPDDSSGVHTFLSRSSGNTRNRYAIRFSPITNTGFPVHRIERDPACFDDERVLSSITVIVSSRHHGPTRTALRISAVFQINPYMAVCMAIAKSLEKNTFRYADHTANTDSSVLNGKFRPIREIGAQIGLESGLCSSHVAVCTSA